MTVLDYILIAIVAMSTAIGLMRGLVSEVIARVPAGGMQLLAGVASGVVAYTAWLSLSWVVMKRPEGIESTVMDLLVHRANRLAGK